jgi:hypothetical protein
MSGIKTFFRSDKLVELRQLLERFPVFEPVLKELVQVWFVVDACIIQGELRWRLGSRRDREARSSFHECIESGIFVAVAPFHIKAEIQEHLADIAKDESATVAEVRAEWDMVQRKLHFYEPQSSGMPVTDVVDPDDLPYKFASDDLGLPVYSRNIRHFRAMNIPLIAVCLDLTARKYARAKSITMGITVYSTITITFAAEAIAAFCRTVGKLFAMFMHLPKWIQLAAAGVLAGLLIHPTSRSKIISGARTIYNGAANMKPEALAKFVLLADEFVTALLIEQQAGNEIGSALPQKRKRSALMYARATFVTSKTPLSITELEKRIRIQGYSSRARDLKGYLRRLLRKSEQFFEISPGLWALKAHH